MHDAGVRQGAPARSRAPRAANAGDSAADPPGIPALGTRAIAARAEARDGPDADSGKPLRDRPFPRAHRGNSIGAGSIGIFAQLD